MIKRNEAFICEHCGAKVPKHPTSERNHCTVCLYSKHEDLQTPGDRLSLCHGQMAPVALEYDGKKGYQIIHQCEKCGKQKKNIVADDDDWDRVIALSGEF